MKRQKFSIGQVPTGKVPVIIEITDGNSLKNVKKMGADATELRLDLFDYHDLSRVRKLIEWLKPLLILLTIRSKEEGGGFSGSESDRVRLFAELMPCVDGVNIELSSNKILEFVVERAHAYNKPTIVSFHDLEKTTTSKELDEKFKHAQEVGADVFKAAVMVNNLSDISQLQAWARGYACKSLITIMSIIGTEQTSKVAQPSVSIRLELGSVFSYDTRERQLSRWQMSCREASKAVQTFY